MAIAVATEFIEAARVGDPADIERLVITVWPEAFRLARSILGEQQAAEDAAQEACIILYRTIASLRSAAAFRVWFYRIVVREAAELKRRLSRGEPTRETSPTAPDQNASIDVWHALSALPKNLREVVVLRYFEDLSSREIASVLRIPDGTVRFRLMIARRRLRPLLVESSQHVTQATSKVRTNAI